MRRVLISVVAVFLIANHAASQTTPTAPTAVRDAQAVTVFSAAISKMGGLPPADSTAQGTVHVVAGSRVEDGTINILTRGMTQTKEQLTLPSGQQVFVYSDGLASENLNAAKVQKSGELAESAQSLMFPLPLFASAYASNDVSLSFVGAETLGAASTNHIRIRNAHGSSPSLQYLSNLSQRDVWLDSTSGLPLRVAYQRRISSGASPSIAIALEYLDYRSVNGYMYPFQIKKYVNGTLWATITIQSVTFNSGLLASDFTVQ